MKVAIKRKAAKRTLEDNLKPNPTKKQKQI